MQIILKCYLELEHCRPGLTAAKLEQVLLYVLGQREYSISISMGVRTIRYTPMYFIISIKNFVPFLYLLLKIE